MLRGSFRDGDYRIPLRTLGQIPVQNSRTLIHVLTFLLEASNSMKTSCTSVGFKQARLHHDGTFCSAYEGLMTAYVYASNIYEAVAEMSVNADLWFGLESSSVKDQVPIFQFPFQFLGLFFIVKAVVHIKSC